MFQTPSHPSSATGKTKIKDEIVAEEKFGVIYNIRCKDCDAEYNGETARKLGTRAK